MKSIEIINKVKLSAPLILIAIIIGLLLFAYYWKQLHGKGDKRDHVDVGIDLTSVDDIKSMRTEMEKLMIDCVKFIRENYNLKLTDIGKSMWRKRGVSDQWTMAIATDDIDGYKRGDIIWSGDPAILCSGENPFCRIAQAYFDKIEKLDKKTPIVAFKDLDVPHDDLAIITDQTVDGDTWIVAFETMRTKQGRWIKRSEGYIYPMQDRRMVLFAFGVYDYTGVLYDYNASFADNLKNSLGLK